MATIEPNEPKVDLEETLTKHHKTSSSHGFMSFMSRRNRYPFRAHMHIPSMMDDSRIGFGIELLKGPLLSKSKFVIETDNPEIKKYINKQVTRFWKQSAKTSLDSIVYGFSGSEVLYKFNNTTQMMDFKKLKHLPQKDVRPVVRDGELIAMKVKNIEHKGALYLPRKKFLWTVHDRNIDKWFGRSRLKRAFLPWWEQWMPQGYRDIRQLWFYKNAFQGPIAKVPHGATKDENGQLVPNVKVGQELVDRYATGAGIVLTKGTDDSQEWELESPKGNAIPEGLLMYGDKLGIEIWEGLGIPPEVIESDGTGAFNGRKIPQQAFFSILQDMVDEQIMDFDEQVLEPLVKLNFGPQADYEINSISLLEIMAQEDIGAITGQMNNDDEEEEEEGEENIKEEVRDNPSDPSADPVRAPNIHNNREKQISKNNKKKGQDNA